MRYTSEERKPDGLFEIPTQDAFVKLVIDRDVKVLYGIGSKTAEKLKDIGITIVRDIRNNRQHVIDMLGKHGRMIVELADGIDNRPVTVYTEADAKSISCEVTFQQDTTDFDMLKDVLVLLARDLSQKTRSIGLFARTVTLKITYGNMQSITRSKSGELTNITEDIYKIAAALLDKVERNPVRLVGVGVQNLTDTYVHQLNFEDMNGEKVDKSKGDLEDRLLTLQQKYGLDLEYETDISLFEVINQMVNCRGTV